MKKVITLLVSTAMLLSMAACGGGKKAEETPKATESTTQEQTEQTTEQASAEATAPAENGEKKYVAIISKGFQHQFWQVVNKGAEQAAKDFNVEITFDGPPTESDISVQVEQLKSALDKKPAAICLAALDTESVMEQLEYAKENKIPIVGFDSGVPNAPDGAIYATASTDNAAAAAIAADHLFANPEFKAKFDTATADAPIVVGVLSQDATSESVISRTVGFMEKLAELAGQQNTKISGHDKYKKDAENPKLHIVVNVPATTSAMDLKTGAESLLNQNPVAIYGSNESAANGIFAASNDGSDFNKESGKYKDIIGIGFDAGATQRVAVENGWFYGSITQDPYQIGYKAVELAVKAMNGETVESKVVDTGAKWYDAEALKDPAISDLVYQ